MSYKVEFIDNTSFIGGDVDNSKWNEMPIKPIKKITYFFAGHKILLENYEAYNHVVEHTLFIQKGTNILNPTLMVKKGNNVLKLTFDRQKSEFGYNLADWGKEWKGKAHPGWKEGIFKGKPKIEYF